MSPLEIEGRKGVDLATVTSPMDGDGGFRIFSQFTDNAFFTGVSQHHQSVCLLLV